MYTLVSWNNSQFIEVLDLKDLEPNNNNWPQSIDAIGGVLEEDLDKISKLELKYNCNEDGFIVGYKSNGDIMNTLHDFSFFIPTIGI